MSRQHTAALSKQVGCARNHLTDKRLTEQIKDFGGTGLKVCFGQLQVWGGECRCWRNRPYM
eukprot:1695075-Pyramimonas_sp.AAC.2